MMLAVSGCGDEPTSAEDSATDLADAVCELIFGCCSSGEAAVLLGPYVTADDCSTRVVNSASLAPGTSINLAAFGAGSVQLPNLADLQRAIDDGRTEVNGDGVTACVEYISGLACNVPVEPEVPPEGCVPPDPPVETPCDSDKLFSGRVGDGGRCSSPGVTFECEQGLACRSGGALGVEGACVEPGDVGDLCFFDAECTIDLYCSQFDGTCAVPKAEGETCLFANPEELSPSPATLLIECESSLTCDPVTDTCVAACERGASCFGDVQCDEDAGLSCIVNRCDLPRADGLPCGANDDCESDRCEFDPPTSGFLCAPKLANGELCFGPDDECESGFCDFSLNQCAAMVSVGSLCPTSRDSQCDAGYCETAFVSCTVDADCLGSGTCNIGFGRCEYYCVAQRADGAMCTSGGQCQSESCVDGFCRTLPLADGQPCSFDFQCESEFCGLEITRVCATLPLSNGASCSSSFQCDSGVCFAGQCDPGLSGGDPCGNPSNPPCGRDLFCGPDTLDCIPVREAGEPCLSSLECRGACIVAFSRQVCDTTPAADTAVCDAP